MNTERDAFEKHYEIPNDVIYCLYSNQYWYIVDGEDEVKKHQELSDKWHGWQAKSQSPVVPEVPKAVIRSANLKWFDEDDINGTKNALVLRFKDYDNIVPFVYFLADMSLLNKEGA